ncbi:hypothetical protein BGZ80_001599 [Entomortierella chlamydospora]|uniref:Uncharacterized protein n=1 Tax=Entomortierella chlamydospora TaxID=101097 RepID=A0A9P6SXN5_9FUNG|nr:hypothetical protein BGZ79_010602 [Entomortierella chlamydospora]KAG0010309.1 hypothetical protein BGZ80_001599 [Entomortierella chlamydospora]
MASIIPFPNVVTHRRMPHLPNSPKPTSIQHPNQEQQQQQKQQQQQNSQQPDYGLQGQVQDSTSSGLRLASGSSSTQRLFLEDGQGQLPHTSGAITGRTVQESERAHRSLHPEEHAQLHKSSSTASSPVMTSHDSKLIKTALYDAFGCLYHPSAHTKHSISNNAIALRSGDVTPLMGLSPKASPLLRPNLGPSAPITPLELSEEGSTAGYFALHVPASSALPAINTPMSGSTPTRHHTHQFRNTHTSSNLSSTFTSDSYEELEHAHQSPISLSRRSSMDVVLDPAEHPVLSSLQALSLSHDKLSFKDSSMTHLRSEPPSAQGSSGAVNPTDQSDASMQYTRALHTSPTSNFFSLDHNEHSSISGFGQQGLV